MAGVRLIGGIPDWSARPAPTAYPALFGLQILLVEDELLVSTMLEDMLAEFGCIVVASVPTVADALAAIRAANNIDAAILDVNLKGEKVFPVADLLGNQGVPVVFSTGFGPADLAERYPGTHLLHKPYGPEPLAKLLTDITRH